MRNSKEQFFEVRLYFGDVALKYADFSNAIFEGIAVFKRRNERIHQKADSNKTLEDFRNGLESWVFFRQRIEEDVISSNPIVLFHLVAFKNPQNVTFIDA